MCFGVRKENIVMLDSRGVISNKRKDLTKEKEFFITNRRIETLSDSMKNRCFFRFIRW